MSPAVQLCAREAADVAGCVAPRARKAAEAAELRKMDETRRRAMSQREAQLQQLEDLKVGYEANAMRSLCEFAARSSQLA
jgi:hypothetical protein